MKLGLSNIQELLDIIGNPHRKFQSIHVAGSNGKGSVSAMLAAAFISNGFRTGLYTSPHLVDYRERIRIGSELIPEDYIQKFAEKYWGDVERIGATFFEVSTALALSYFAEAGVEVAVIETGLGGRLDATNVLENPLATVVTSISLEHTAQLGDTLEKIAAEKAGIMKPHARAIVNVHNDLRHVFSKRASDVDAPIIFAQNFAIEAVRVKAPFFGDHQEENLRTVLATLSMMKFPLKKELNESGIARTTELTGFRGRLEECQYQPALAKGLTLLLDVAHNPDAFRKLKEYFNQLNKKPMVIAGFAKDKDIPKILEEISAFASMLIVVEADNKRAAHAEEIAAVAESIGLPFVVSTNPSHGVDEAIAISQPNDIVLLTGSHYVVGDFLAEHQ